MKTMLATPLEDIFQVPMFAMVDGEQVTIYDSISGKELDEFTLDEYTDMISDGTLNKETRRLTVNW